MNILEQIQNAEQQAAEIKRNAHAQGRDIVRDGESKAQETAAKSLDAAEELAAQKRNEVAAAAEEKAKHFVLDCAQKDDVLIGKAKANMQKAAQYIAGPAEDMK